ncbi:MAG TPA: hypothetical protein PKY81_17250, partial [bacterium]|nr:hypothetical protein [bacterium]
MYSKSKLFVLFFILLSALAITVNEVKAADSFTLQTWVGGVRIGDTMPRNVAQSTLSSSIINFKYVNNTSTDTFFKVTFKKEGLFDLIFSSSKSSNSDSLYNHTGMWTDWYSDSAGIINSSYRISPNSVGSNSTTFRLNSFTLRSPTYWTFYAGWANSLLFGGEATAYPCNFLFQPIAANDIGFDIRYDSTYRSELTGATVNIRIATNNTTQVDGRTTGSDTDRRDNLTYKNNGLVYFLEGAGNDFQN